MVVDKHRLSRILSVIALLIVLAVVLVFAMAVLAEILTTYVGLVSIFADLVRIGLGSSR